MKELNSVSAHLEVAVHARVAEGVPARRVDGLHEGLQADLAHEVLVDVALVVVQVRLVVRVVLQQGAIENSLMAFGVSREQ